MIALQDQDPQSDYYGVWPYFLEEPIAQMSPPDRNWADFNGVTLLQVVQDYGHRLPDSLVADIDAALGRAAEAIRRRDVGPGYTNIAIMGTFVTLAVAERLNDPDLREYGMERLQRFYDFTVENDQAFSEYNSPTYTPVALRELGRMRTYLQDPEVRRLVDPLYRWAWEEIAYHWHAPSRQWAGPHSRSYGTLLGDRVPGLVQRASDGRIDFGVASDFDRIPLPLPRDLEPYFTRLEAPRTFARELASRDVVLTTYLHPAFALGTASHSMLWNQRRALVAYWGAPEAPSYLHLRFLHDDYDFAAAQLFTDQQKGDVLAGIAIATDRRRSPPVAGPHPGCDDPGEQPASAVRAGRRGGPIHPRAAPLAARAGAPAFGRRICLDRGALRRLRRPAPALGGRTGRRGCLARPGAVRGGGAGLRLGCAGAGARRVSDPDERR